MNLALKLTVFRVLLIPVYLAVYLSPFWGSNWVAWVIFSLASVTDFFDGYVARKYQQSTRLGAFLDPLADKLLICVVLISLVYKHNTGWFGLALLVMAATIIGREILISALREFMAAQNIRDAVAVKYVGKLKTTVQIFALGFLIIYEHAGFIPTWEMGYILLFIATVLTVYSMWNYCLAAGHALKNQGVSWYQ